MTAALPFLSLPFALGALALSLATYRRTRRLLRGYRLIAEVCNVPGSGPALFMRDGTLPPVGTRLYIRQEGRHL